MEGQTERFDGCHETVPGTSLTEDEALYIRADLSVLASHHQRVIEALREAVAKALEARAQYFDQAKRNREWENTARSYRATAKEVDKAISAALNAVTCKTMISDNRVERRGP
jgi:hypothetical protein